MSHTPPAADPLQGRRGVADASPSRGAPLVSVIIPTYNSARYLPQAIDSVLGQTIQDYEIVIVDDGSTDGTGQVLQQYAGRVRSVRQPNAGNAAARNRGVAEARGRWICFLDADDTWEPGKLEIQLRDLQAHPAARFSFTRARKFYPDGRTETIPDSPAPHEVWDKLVFYQAFSSSHSGLMVDRACLSAVGGFDEQLRLSVDWDLFIRLTRRYPFRTLPDFLMNHRQHAGNTTRQSEVRLSMYLACLRKHRQLFCRELGMRRQWHESYGNRLFHFGRHAFKSGRFAQARVLLLQSLRYGGRRQWLPKAVLLVECLMALMGVRGPAAGFRGGWRRGGLTGG